MIDASLDEDDVLAAARARSLHRRVYVRDVIADARDDAHYVDFMLRDALAIAQRTRLRDRRRARARASLDAITRFADRAQPRRRRHRRANRTGQLTTTREYLDRTPPAGVRISYGEAPEQFGELRLPRGAGPFPVAVVVHGGWWRSAFGLSYAGHMANALTGDGFASWNIEFRRMGNPGGGYPGTLEDVTAALAALTAIARDAPLDLTRIVVTGHSAGGHLAAWLAAKQAQRALDRFGLSPPLIGAVPVAGVLDLERTSRLRVADGAGIPVHDLLGGAHDEVPERYALASPVASLPAGIPVIAVHGTADTNVPLELSRSYVERARAAGDPAELIVLDGVDHFAIFDPATPAGGTVREAIGRLLTRRREDGYGGRVVRGR